MSGLGRRMLADLGEMLSRERAMLREGRFDALAEQAAAREALTHRLEALPAADLADCAGPLARVRASAERNVRLLKAALEGAAAGRRRVTEIVEARGRLSSYDAQGAPVDRTAPASGTGRRA